MKKSFIWADVERALEKYPYPKESCEIFVFGAGFLGRTLMPLLQKEGLRIMGFCDNDPRKHEGKNWKNSGGGVKSGKLGSLCIPPQELLSYKSPFVLVASIKYYDAIRKQLSEQCVPCCTADAYVVRKYLPEFLKVYQLLDEESRNIYAGVLLGRINGDRSGIRELCSEGQYFALPEFRFCGPGEVFVDCGAFTGEDSETFLRNAWGNFHKIFAFEINPDALGTMKRRVDRLHEIQLFKREQVTFVQKFVSDRDGVKIPFHRSETNLGNGYIDRSADQNASRMQWIETVSLDRYFQDRGEDKLTFLKADIEGAEWDMLHGAKKIIQTNRPKIAVCIYHSIYDLFRIPLLLKDWVPEYHLAVRQHWYSFEETVLYCYV